MRMSEAPAFNPAGGAAGDLLSYLAWCASAAGVIGLIVVGLQLAIQLRRGEPGEGATYFRGAATVVAACIVATTAGPIVSVVGIFSLK